MGGRYFEDIDVGESETVGPYEVAEAEMIDFACRWDPLPIHIDPASEEARARGGVIASGQYTLAVKQRLLTRTSFLGPPVIGAAGWEELRFVNPVRPGHSLYLTVECLEKRPSRSRPDRGLIRFGVSMAAGEGEPVLSYLDLVVYRRRERPPFSAGE